MNKGENKTMRMVFNHSMPMGSYLIVIRFSQNNCVLEIEREKITP